VRKNKQVNKSPTAFRKLALERLKSCRNATELAAELGIHRTQLYKWRDQMEPIEDGPGPAANSRERQLRKEIRELNRVLGEKVLEVDFFKRCLAKNRGSTPEQRRLWREGVYDRIREWMPMQGSLSIERMCGLRQPGGLLPVAAGADTGGRRHGSAVGDSDHRAGTSAPLWIPQDH